MEGLGFGTWEEEGTSWKYRKCLAKYRNYFYSFRFGGCVSWCRCRFLIFNFYSFLFFIFLFQIKSILFIYFYFLAEFLRLTSPWSLALAFEITVKSKKRIKRQWKCGISRRAFWSFDNKCTDQITKLRAPYKYQIS